MDIRKLFEIAKKNKEEKSKLDDNLNKTNEPIYISDEYKSKEIVNQRPEKAIAVDFGENATAFCVGMLYTTPIVIENVGVSTPGVINTARDAAIAMAEIFTRLPRVDTYILEEQPRIGFSTCLMETALASLAYTVKDAYVIHVPTSRMTSAYGLPSGNDARHEAFVIEMEKILKSDAFSISENVFRILSEIDRQHDVAVAIVHFAWYATLGIQELERWRAYSICGWSFRATAARNLKSEQKRNKNRKSRLDKKFRGVICGCQNTRRVYNKLPTKRIRRTRKRISVL